MNRAKAAESPLTGPLVVALVYDRLCTFEFSIVAEIFGLARPEMGRGWYRFRSAAIEPGPLRAHGGLTVATEGGLQLLKKADLIVVPGWKGVDEPLPPRLANALKAAWQRGARLASICSGAFVLAATGLLDGRRAATHWRYSQALAERYPAIEVDARVLFVGEDRIFTSAGSSAGIDLMLHLVRSDFGWSAANSVARRLVMPAQRDGGQAQFIVRPVARDRKDHLAALLDDVRRHPERDWRVSAMAQAVSMTPRTFLRRFAESTGMTPAEWVSMVRVDEAKRLLETTAHSVERIAADCGFGSVQVMRQHFRKVVAVPPAQYRRSFSRG
jgi:AraC family transcriptional activator FtrA